MKFYFAAHTKKLDQYIPIYKKIIKKLEDSNWRLVDNWLKREVEAQKGERADFYDYYKNLYNRTSKKIKFSDVLVAEISEKSTTVAQQIVYALENNIPTWCLYQKSHEDAIPAFIKTRKDTKLNITAYNDSNVETIIQNNVTDYSRREIKFNFYLTQEMNDFLEKQSKVEKTSKSEVVRKLITKEINKTR